MPEQRTLEDTTPEQVVMTMPSAITYDLVLRDCPVEILTYQDRFGDVVFAEEDVSDWAYGLFEQESMWTGFLHDRSDDGDEGTNFAEKTEGGDVEIHVSPDGIKHLGEAIHVLRQLREGRLARFSRIDLVTYTATTLTVG